MKNHGRQQEKTRKYTGNFNYEQKLILAKAIRECDLIEPPKEENKPKQSLRAVEFPEVVQGELFRLKPLPEEHSAD